MYICGEKLENKVISRLKKAGGKKKEQKQTPVDCCIYKSFECY